MRFSSRRIVFVAHAALAAASVGLFAGADWAQFRGSDNKGVAPDTNLPIKWSDHVAWKADLPGRGPSSPIVVGQKVFVTASSGPQQKRLHLVCFDAKDGTKLWERQLWATGRTFCHPSSAVAAPTPASDGRRVFAFYSSNDLACYDLEGNLQWFRGLSYDYPKAGNDVGMSSSPLVVGTTVVVQIENQGDSFAAGLDAATGETRWRIDRTRRANWASPIVWRGATRDDDLVLLQSPGGISAHDPMTGKLAWEFKTSCAGIPSAVVDGGVVFVPAGGMTALRPGSTAEPELVWQDNRLGPGAASPVVHDGKLYTVNRSGVLVCGDAASGEILWRLRLEAKGGFWATPVLAGEHLYLVNASGTVHTVKLGKEGQLAGSSELEETIQGTPAVADGAAYLRSNGHLIKVAVK